MPRILSLRERQQGVDMQLILSLRERQRETHCHMPLILKLRERRPGPDTPQIPNAGKTAANKRYAKYRHAILQRLKTYSTVVRRSAARLLHHARHRLRENAKNKAYRQTNGRSILSAKRGRYVLMEPKMDVKRRYVQNLQHSIHAKAEKLLQAFRSSCNTLNEKVKTSKLHVTRAVVNISSRKLLNRVLKVRKHIVWENCCFVYDQSMY